MWIPDGRSLLFTQYSTRGSPSLWRMSFPAPGLPEPVPVSADNASWRALSPKGDSLVFTPETENANPCAVETAGSPFMDQSDQDQ